MNGIDRLCRSVVQMGCETSCVGVGPVGNSRSRVVVGGDVLTTIAVAATGNGLEVFLGVGGYFCMGRQHCWARCMSCVVFSGRRG